MNILKHHLVAHRFRSQNCLLTQSHLCYWLQAGNALHAVQECEELNKEGLTMHFLAPSFAVSLIAECTTRKEKGVKVSILSEIPSSSFLFLVMISNYIMRKKDVTIEVIICPIGLNHLRETKQSLV